MISNVISATKIDIFKCSSVSWRSEFDSSRNNANDVNMIKNYGLCLGGSQPITIYGSPGDAQYSYLSISVKPCQTDCDNALSPDNVTMDFGFIESEFNQSDYSNPWILSTQKKKASNFADNRTTTQYINLKTMIVDTAYDMINPNKDPQTRYSIDEWTD